MGPCLRRHRNRRLGRKRRCLLAVLQFPPDPMTPGENRHLIGRWRHHEDPCHGRDRIYRPFSIDELKVLLTDKLAKYEMPTEMEMGASPPMTP